MNKEKRTPLLCDATRCTACSACMNACPTNAIAMKEDAFGELHPVIDAETCIGCLLCERTCPEKDGKTIDRFGPPIVYCCWLKDAEKRKESTSGGAAYAMSLAVIKDGGHVWGAAYDGNLSVRYTEANSEEELKLLQKSKYVQSYVDDAFRKIKAELESGDRVLFIGTGCHVKGLRAYLRRDYPNLLTADLICHGVPGQGVFMAYKAWVEKLYGDTLVGYFPRHKRQDGQETVFSSIGIFAKRGPVHLQLKENAYFTGFQHNLFLRTNCHDCRANGEERYADITIGDFWGIGKLSPFKDYKQRTLGISMLALNSEKARTFFTEFSDLLDYEERTYGEASYANTQYYRSAKPSPRREQFREEFASGQSWDELAARYMRLSRKELALYAIKKFTPPICYHMLNYWRNG